jgi:hypothetical protein
MYLGERTLEVRDEVALGKDLDQVPRDKMLSINALVTTSLRW